jgi:hypothetical protein
MALLLRKTEKRLPKLFSVLIDMFSTFCLDF